MITLDDLKSDWVEAVQIDADLLSASLCTEEKRTGRATFYHVMMQDDIDKWHNWHCRWIKSKSFRESYRSDLDHMISEKRIHHYPAHFIGGRGSGDDDQTEPEIKRYSVNDYWNLSMPPDMIDMCPQNAYAIAVAPCSSEYRNLSLPWNIYRWDGREWPQVDWNDLLIEDKWPIINKYLKLGSIIGYDNECPWEPLLEMLVASTLSSEDLLWINVRFWFRRQDTMVRDTFYKWGKKHVQGTRLASIFPHWCEKSWIDLAAVNEVADRWDALPEVYKVLAALENNDN